MNQGICIVHFQPPEKYPPVINFARFIAVQQEFDGRLHLLTTHPGKGKPLSDLANVSIRRLSTWKKRNRWQRLIFYCAFNWKSFWWLARYRPHHVIYFETLSAFGPWLYKKWLNRKAHLYIHYHEYTSPREYSEGMALNNWLHKKEKQLYPVAAWVSHTNADRLELFLKDQRGKAVSNPSLMPNYPPSSWSAKAWTAKKKDGQGIGFVYVGALSLHTMYTREMAEFVASNTGKCYWHIYSDNHDEDVLAFLKSLHAPNIHFMGAVPYDQLPEVLPAYDIGIIMYNGSTLNYTYNAPNKFFEYLACGLNIWFAHDMQGMHAYISHDEKPWVRRVDFTQLNLPAQEEGLRAKQMPQQIYSAETVYSRLWQLMRDKQSRTNPKNSKL